MKMGLPRLLLVAGLGLTLGAQPAHSQPVPSAEELVERTLAYHDPGGAWAAGRHRFRLREERPGSRDRATVVTLEPGTRGFAFRSEREGRVLEARLDDGGCTATIDGVADFSAELRDRYRLSCEGLAWLRAYYGYLLGLPMKLRDPGTRLGAVERTRFADQDVLALRVTYDAEVGSDVWYFYVDPATHALVGARFYHDEAAGDGEYLVFEGETAADGARWPRARRWYTNAEGEYLGADIIEHYERLQ